MTYLNRFIVWYLSHFMRKQKPVDGFCWKFSALWLHHWTQVLWTQCSSELFTYVLSIVWCTSYLSPTEKGKIKIYLSRNLNSKPNLYMEDFRFSKFSTIFTQWGLSSSAAFQALDFLNGTVDTLPKNNPTPICPHCALHLVQDVIANTGTLWTPVALTGRCVSVRGDKTGALGGPKGLCFNPSEIRLCLVLPLSRL